MKNYSTSLNTKQADPRNSFPLLLCCFFMMALCLPAFSQVQLGNDIDGEAASDRSGWSVSLSADGSRLAVGAQFNNGAGIKAGHVRVYNWNGSAWAQLGVDIDGEAANDLSGLSVSLSIDGSRLAVGAPWNNGNGNYAGHVRVYAWDGSSWGQLGEDIEGEAASDHSGFSVSLSANGSRLAVGALLNDGNGSNAGHFRVYAWDGSSWGQLGGDIDGEASGDKSGFSVSLSADGSRLAVGAPYNVGAGINAGHVRVYNWTGSSWVQLGTDIDGEASGDESGFSVSLSADGNRLAVGARYNSGAGINAGHVRVYAWDGSSWGQLGVDIDGEAASDQSGRVSLSADGNRLAVGAPDNDGTVNRSGQVRVYNWTGLAWTQLGIDIDGEATTDVSGSSVSLSADGKRLAIGAPSNDGTGQDAGHVRVYSLLPVSAVIKIDQTNIEFSPNPTTGIIQLSNVNADRVQLLDNIGCLVFSQEQPGSAIDIPNLPAGFYFMKIYAGDAVYSARVIKE